MGKLLDENSKWVAENYPEFVRALDKADAQEKAKNRAAENEEFKDKRQPKSDLIRQAELEKMKEILDKPRSGGGGGGGGIPKVGPKKPTDMKKGGMVSSASKRADGCAQRGKTKGRMV
jgi:hypothetical protein